MQDLSRKEMSGVRPFSLRALQAAGLPRAPHNADELIGACQMKHLGCCELASVNDGAWALARWLARYPEEAERPVAASHPFANATTIERILAGDIIPHEDFAFQLSAVTGGFVHPELFERRVPYHFEKPSAEVSPPLAEADGKSSPRACEPTPAHAGAAASVDGGAAALPSIGVIGGPLPAGALAHAVADGRCPDGFVLVLAGGVSLYLDVSTGRAAREAINAGLGLLESRRTLGALRDVMGAAA